MMIYMHGCGKRHAMRHGGWGHGFGGHWGGRGRGGRDGDGGGRGRGSRRRMFDTGELRLVLLKLIADEPRHGYDLIRQIEELTGGAYAPSPGVVYPTITLLGDMGLIEAQDSDGSKKLFAVTDEGKAELEANKDVVEALIARLFAVGEEQQKTESTSVRRAMGNLRQVLINRLTSGDVDDDVLHQVTALIDEAAQKIERL